MGTKVFPRVRLGLGFMVLGVIANIVDNILTTLGSNGTLPYDSVFKAIVILPLVALLVQTIGLFICGTSSSKHFTKALVYSIIAVILQFADVILAFFAVTIPASVIELLMWLASVLLFFSNVNVVKGCGEVSKSPLVKVMAVVVYLGLIVGVVANFVYGVLSAIPALASQIASVIAIIASVASIATMIGQIGFAVVLVSSFLTVR